MRGCAKEDALVGWGGRAFEHAQDMADGIEVALNLFSPWRSGNSALLISYYNIN